MNHNIVTVSRWMAFLNQCHTGFLSSQYLFVKGPLGSLCFGNDSHSHCIHIHIAHTDTASSGIHGHLAAAIDGGGGGGGGGGSA